MANRFTDAARKAMGEVTAANSEEIARLSVMYERDFSGLLPATADCETVKALKDAVDRAAQTNMSQAQLVDNVRKLGDSAVALLGRLIPIIQ